MKNGGVQLKKFKMTLLWL